MRGGNVFRLCLSGGLVVLSIDKITQKVMRRIGRNLLVRLVMGDDIDYTLLSAHWFILLHVKLTGYSLMKDE